MNREIKFRAWYKEEQELWYDIQNTVDWEFAICDREEEKYILMQFTGLKDKNGKEIFEGDIVKLSDQLYVITWDSRFLMFKLVHIKPKTWKKKRPSSLGIWALVDVNPITKESSPASEIVGNIFENPELVEEK